MSFSSETEMKLMASHWLNLWADCERARQTDGGAQASIVLESRSSMYVKGAPGAKEYRPRDDPDPMFFVFSQVEFCLGPEGGVLRQFAHHVWMLRLSPEEFAHPEVENASRATLYRLRDRLLTKLGRQIGMKFPEWTGPTSLLQARTRARLERQRGVRSRVTGKLV